MWAHGAATDAAALVAAEQGALMNSSCSLPLPLPLLGFPRDLAQVMRGMPFVPALPQPAKDLMSLPFGAARAQYANAVSAGLLARSLLASARFERSMDALEKLAYGPFARRV